VGAVQGRALMLRLEGLAAGYGAASTVSDISLQVAPGEVFCLLGGSGSGKTTLLRCIAGFLPVQRGQILLAGEDVTRRAAHQRDVTTLFQSYALFPHMNVAENVAFGLRRRGMRGAEAAARVSEMLTLVRLAGFEGRRIAELSGGQQQRVALARCLAPRPRLLLLDEPLSALDPELRAATRNDLVALLRAQGMTSVLVTHDRGEALAVADRIGLLQSGRLVQTDTPEALFERPVNSAVAGFLGDVVLLDAVVRASGTATELQLSGGMALAAASDHAPGARVILALRPERLRLGVASGINTLAGHVTALTYAGASVEIDIALPDGAALRVVHPADRARPVPGELVRVGWTQAAAMVLAS